MHFVRCTPTSPRFTRLPEASCQRLLVPASCNCSFNQSNARRNGCGHATSHTPRKRPRLRLCWPKVSTKVCHCNNSVRAITTTRISTVCATPSGERTNGYVAKFPEWHSAGERQFNWGTSRFNAACSVFISLLSCKSVHWMANEAKMFAHPIYHFIYSAKRTKMQPHLANINHTTCWQLSARSFADFVATAMLPLP